MCTLACTMGKKNFAKLSKFQHDANYCEYKVAKELYKRKTDIIKSEKHDNNHLLDPKMEIKKY